MAVSCYGQTLKHNETSCLCSFSIFLYPYHQETRTQNKAVTRSVNDGTPSAEVSECTQTQGGSALVFATVQFPVMIKSSDPLIHESAVEDGFIVGVNKGYF